MTPRSSAHLETNYESIQQAIKLMRKARTLLRIAGARRAYQRTCRALNSAEGAARHAGGRADAARLREGAQ